MIAVSGIRAINPLVACYDDEKAILLFCPGHITRHQPSLGQIALAVLGREDYQIFMKILIWPRPAMLFENGTSMKEKAILLFCPGHHTRQIY
jgi:hypothetical protein